MAAKTRTVKGVATHPLPPAEPPGAVQQLHLGAARPEQADPDERRRARRGLFFFILAAILIVLLIVGGLAYQQWAAVRTRAQRQYNGFDFTPVQQGSLTLWTTRIEVSGKPYDIPFYYHPRDTESVLLEENVTDGLVQPASRPQILYLSFPNDVGSSVIIAGIEVSRITGYKYGLLDIDTHGAVQTPLPGNATDMAVVTCDQATMATGVLFFSQARQNAIYADQQDPYCIHLDYTNATEAVRVADRFAYGLLRVMPG